MVGVGIAMFIQTSVKPNEGDLEMSSKWKSEMFSEYRKWEMELFSIVNNVYFLNIVNKKYRKTRIRKRVNLW